ncbi:MAG: DUF2085 domain-containing protein [Coprobacillus sp.]
MNNFIELMLYRLSHIGQIPLCNGVEERAPHIFGVCLPLCYRCTFILLLFCITLFISYKYKKDLPIWILIICLIPMIIDGGLQTFMNIESTNLRRILTGSVFGFGLGMMIAKTYRYVDQRL